MEHQPSSILDGALRAYVEAIVDQRLKTAIPTGDTPRALRLAKGLSVRELADRAGCSTGVISKIESGRSRRPSVDVMNRIGRALGCGEQTYRASVARQLDRGVAA